MLCINYANFILLYKIHVCILFQAFFVVEVYGRCCQCFSFTSLTSPSIKDTTSIETYVSQLMHNRWFFLSLLSCLLSFTHENTPKKHFHACFPMPSIVFQLQQRMAILTLWIINKFSLLFLSKPLKLKSDLIKKPLRINLHLKSLNTEWHVSETLKSFIFHAI